MTMSPTNPLAKSLTGTILSGATGLSAAINLRGGTLCGIYMPGTWVSAALTFQACDTEDGTFLDVVGTDGTELSFTVAASQYIHVNPLPFYGINFLRLRSGVSATPVNQTADRDLTLMLARPVIQ